MDKVTFKINGTEYSVGNGEVSSDVMLLDYLRNHLDLRGTKYMCREGGCGACIVAASTSPGEMPYAVNSCLVSILSCDGWEITSIEAVGNRHDGYHPIQKGLAEGNGTQCGYCSPGWVMAMYSLLNSKKELSMLEIEQSFASNICRCTGYRPILEAFKKFASDAPKSSTMLDIEDLYICKKMCNKQNINDNMWYFVKDEDVISNSNKEIKLIDEKLWYKVDNVKKIFDIFESKNNQPYMLVSGNTAKGVYPIGEYPYILIDISKVTEMQGFKLDQNLILGAGTSITKTMDIFQKISMDEEYFNYLKKFNEHMNLVANIPVKNLGSIGGNLMTKNKNKEFQSDIFILCETVGAVLTILSTGGKEEIVTMQQFLKLDMQHKIIYNVILPPLNDDYSLVTYKIMPRAQNAHALVNCGFLYKLDKSDNTVKECTIIYGGLSAEFERATKTEQILVGKDLFSNETLQLAVDTLDNEIKADENPLKPSADYRKRLAIGLFYKSLLTLCPVEKLGSRYVSGAKNLSTTRPLSQAHQVFQTDSKIYPLNQPIPKIEAIIQCSGEAEYTDDHHSLRKEVFAAFVLSTVAIGDIELIDPKEALAQPGVLAFYTAKDIPGTNNFMPSGLIIFNGSEEIFCSGNVKYFNQPIGIIVAESQHVAERAAKLVQVKYTNIKKPTLDIKEAKNEPSRSTLVLSKPAIGKGLDTFKVIKNEYTIYGQYHFCMENLSCVTWPTEDGLQVHASTQWPDIVQIFISRALKIQQNKIDVRLRRLGGGFGLKISRVTQIAVACSLVSLKLNRPCRFIQSLKNTMKSIGKRFPCTANIEVGVSKRGVIQYMEYELYEDNGYAVTELVPLLGFDVLSNCYDGLKWDFKSYSTITDNAKNTFCRAPGTLEHIAMAENIMEQISYELDLDPLDVRFANMSLLKYADYKEMVNNVKEKSEYTKRRLAVDKFNTEHRWKKRGLRWAFMKWEPLSPAYFDINLSVYHGDGSVIITHGGVEMGQGINTKAVQICAYFLKIPMEKIQIKANDTTTSPNSLLTGSSVTSQNIGRGVQKCCEELLKRLAPVRILLLNPAWEDLIEKAHTFGVDLQVHEIVVEVITPIFTAMGVTLAEVEIDVLTGESQILRVDLLEDVGRSISPLIDIGQVEGAFIMGVGYWTSEKLVYDKDSGELLTNRAWEYHVPQARDIPQDFRIYFRDKSYSGDVALGAKVTGEPPICMSIVVPFAMREGITAARVESGIQKSKWFQIDGPYTTEAIYMATATKMADFKFN